MITLKTLSNYNDRSRVAARQTNKLTQRQKQANIQAEKQKDIQIDAQADLQVDTHTERGKQEMKSEALCSVVIRINKPQMDN